MAAAYHDIAKIACDAIKRAAQTGKITRESVRNALADTSAEALTGNQGSLYVSKQTGWILSTNVWLRSLRVTEQSTLQLFTNKKLLDKEGEQLL